MSKPTTAEEFGIPCDVTRSTIEDAIIRLRETLGGGPVLYYVKVSFPILIYVADDLAKFGMPAVVDPDYSRDEWSMVGVVARDNEMKKAEIWSPGA